MFYFQHIDKSFMVPRRNMKHSHISNKICKYFDLLVLLTILISQSSQQPPRKGIILISDLDRESEAQKGLGIWVRSLWWQMVEPGLQMGSLVLVQCSSDKMRGSRWQGVKRHRCKEQGSKRKVGALVNSEKEGYRKIDSQWFRVGWSLRSQLCLPCRLGIVWNKE